MNNNKREILVFGRTDKTTKRQQPRKGILEIFKGHVWTVPGNMFVKFEVRMFSGRPIGKISI